MGDRIINHVVLLPVDQIDPNPGQPRRVFVQAELEGLAASIEKNGLLQPIHVRKLGGRYELIAGERRLRAYRLLGYYEIPSIVEEMDGQSSKVLALI